MTKNERAHWIVVVVLALAAAVAGIGAAPQGPESPDVRLGAGLHKEQVEGNYEAAIAIYSSVAADPRAARPVVARALFQLAGCYARLGRPEAAATYRRVVNEYADSGALVASA